MLVWFHDRAPFRHSSDVLLRHGTDVEFVKILFEPFLSQLKFFLISRYVKYEAMVHENEPRLAALSCHG